MISREQFEALVRAEADVKYAECNYRDMGVRIRAGHKSYIAARMEHEWPLVEIGMKLLNEYNDEQVRMRTPIAYLRKFEELKNELAKLEAQ